MKVQGEAVGRWRWSERVRKLCDRCSDADHEAVVVGTLGPINNDDGLPLGGVRFIPIIDLNETHHIAYIS